MLGILIADDETSMRYVLKKAIEKCENVKIIGEAGSGDEAVALTEEYLPDAVFLDVDMPGINGVEAAKLICDIKPDCMIVFVTAHQQFMPDAFQLYAFDYILKPFKIDRLHETIVRMQVINPQVQLKEPEKINELNEILLKNRNGMAVIHPKDIVLIQRENRSTIIITEDDRFTTTETLGEIEEKLPKEYFLRCHKSYIIQISKIKRLSPYGRWTYIVKLKGITEDALITKEKAEILEERFRIKIG